MTRMRLAMFPDVGTARTVVERLRAGGFEDDRISVLLADSQQARRMLEEERGKPKEGAKLGSAVGGVLWGLTAVGLALPPVGVIAAGPLVAAFAGAGAGAAAGGLLGGLVGLGIPEHEAMLRTAEVEKGAVIVGVSGSDQELERADAILQASEPIDSLTIEA